MLRELAANPHLDQVVAAFGPLRHQAGFVAPDVDFLVLLFTNRSGSNYLAQLLASTGRFNEAGEFFNGDTIVHHVRAQGWHVRAQGWRAECGPAVQDYVRLLPGLVGRDGRVTVKLAVEHLDLLERAGVLQALLPRMRFLLLERQDRLGQAISRAIASQTLRWTTEHPGRLRDDQLVYDRGRIDRELALTELGYRLLYRFLRERGVAPLHFYYEQLVEAPQAHLDRVAAWLRVGDLVSEPGLIRIRRQTSAVNREWRRRYEAVL